MLDLIYNILVFIYNGVVELLDIIVNIPTYINKITGLYQFINLTGNSAVITLITVIVAVSVAIHIKRLIL